MKTLFDFDNQLFDALDSLGKQRHLYAVKGGFVYLMPIMIAGSIAILINNFPLVSYQNFMNSVFGESWTSFGGYLWSVTFAIISMSATITISSSLAAWHKINRGVEISTTQCSIIALSCYLAVCYPQEGFLTASSTGSTGLFVAIAVSLFTTEMIIFLKGKIKVRAFIFINEADGRIGNAFSAMIPSVIALILFAALRMTINVLGLMPLNDMIYYIFQKPFDNLGNNFFSAILFILSAQVMWFFGIHGNNVLDNVATNIYLPAVHENHAALSAGQIPPNMFSKTFFDTFIFMGGSGTTLCLIIALLIFARKSSQDRLAKISLVPGVFNINEILMYGLPIILNPIYAIPFILTPLILLMTSSFATYIGLVPYVSVEVSWTVPAFMSGYIATAGSLSGAILQLVNLTIGVMVYRPFVLLAEKLRIKRFKSTYNRLCELCEDDYSPTHGKRLLNRDDDLGAVARLLSFDLEKAINEKKMIYYFQPIVDGKTNKIVGSETLLRWAHPEYGFISPMVVVALAEDMGLTGALGKSALDSACEQLKRWRDAGHSIYVSCNFSATELKSPAFYDDITKIVNSYGLKHSDIKMEMTETLAVKNDEITNENIRKLGDGGFGIAIDDFGMGHTSLMYIKRFPVTMLKVDKCLSRDLLATPENLEIINSVRNLCESLDIQMVVEFVENAEQLELLSGIGCRLYQGYYFSKPLPPDEFFEYLEYTNFKGAGSNEKA